MKEENGDAMVALKKTLKWILTGADNAERYTFQAPVIGSRARTAPLPVDIVPNDPIVAYFQTAPGAVDIEKLQLDSPALQTLREVGVKLVVPLVSQGELIGLLNLGPRLSEQDYSADDRKLLDDLATQAAPAVRVAQLVRQQQVEARERERIENELRIARIIQQTLLPKELPSLPGWETEAFYQPAMEVGGDFYDFIYFPDGRLGLVVGDVTDKGVPAGLVMATTRSTLRASAERFVSPGKVLEVANNVLHPDIPENMFVTCLYAILEPESGRLKFANAGHNLPYKWSYKGVEELRATGMPLGLLPDMTYEEKVVVIKPGDCLLFSSDGLVEAHNHTNEMFGFDRVKELMAVHAGGGKLIYHILEELDRFTGKQWEQEDDITLFVLRRIEDEQEALMTISSELKNQDQEKEGDLQTIAEFSLQSKHGNERTAMERVAQALQGFSISTPRMERLKTAVAEAVMNAMEHGNQYREELPVTLKVLVSTHEVHVYITDHGSGNPIPQAETPDLDAKLAGKQSPRGWGLFLIQNMVDEVSLVSETNRFTVDLMLKLEGGDHEPSTTS